MNSIFISMNNIKNNFSINGVEVTVEPFYFTEGLDQFTFLTIVTWVFNLVTEIWWEQEKSTI